MVRYNIQVSHLGACFFKVAVHSTLFCKVFLLVWYIFRFQAFLYGNYHSLEYFMMLYSIPFLCEQPALPTKISLHIFVGKNEYPFGTYFADKIGCSNNNT